MFIDGMVIDLAIRTVYGERKRVVTPCTTQSLTKQSFASECDINTIIKRYNATGYLTDPTVKATRIPSFGDFTVVPTFQEAQNKLIEADSAFMALPSSLRARFNNDPAQLIAFLMDDANAAEADELGLTVSKPATEVAAATAAATKAADTSAAADGAPSATK